MTTDGTVGALTVDIIPVAKGFTSATRATLEAEITALVQGMTQAAVAALRASAAQMAAAGGAGTAGAAGAAGAGAAGAAARAASASAAAMPATFTAAQLKASRAVKQLLLQQGRSYGQLSRTILGDATTTSRAVTRIRAAGSAQELQAARTAAAAELTARANTLTRTLAQERAYIAKRIANDTDLHAWSKANLNRQLSEQVTAKQAALRAEVTAVRAAVAQEVTARKAALTAIASATKAAAAQQASLLAGQSIGTSTLAATGVRGARQAGQVAAIRAEQAQILAAMTASDKASIVSAEKAAKARLAVTDAEGRAKLARLETYLKQQLAAEKAIDEARRLELTRSIARQMETLRAGWAQMIEGQRAADAARVESFKIANAEMTASAAQMATRITAIQKEMAAAGKAAGMGMAAGFAGAGGAGQAVTSQAIMRGYNRATFSTVRKAFQGEGVNAATAFRKGVAGAMRNATFGVAGLGLLGLYGAGSAYNDYETNQSKLDVALGKGLNKIPAAMKAAVEKTNKQIGLTTKFAAQDAQKAAIEGSLAGLDYNLMYDDGGRGIKQLLEFSEVAGLDIPTAVKQASSAFNVWKETSKDLGATLDILGGAASASSANIADLALGTQNAGPIVANTGTKFSEFAAALALLSNAGTPPSMAGTSMRQTYTLLRKPTKDIKDVQKEYGISFYDKNNEAKSIPELRKTLQGLTDNQINRIQAAFGTRAGQFLTILADTTDEAWATMMDDVNVDGALSKLSDSWSGKMKLAWQKTIATMKTVSVAFFDSLAPTVTSLGDGLAAIGKAFGDFAKTNPEGAERIAKAIAFIALAPPAIWLMTLFTAPLTGALGFISNVAAIGRSRLAMRGMAAELAAINAANAAGLGGGAALAAGREARIAQGGLAAAGAATGLRGLLGLGGLATGLGTLASAAAPVAAALAAVAAAVAVVWGAFENSQMLQDAVATLKDTISQAAALIGPGLAEIGRQAQAFWNGAGGEALRSVLSLIGDALAGAVYLVNFTFQVSMGTVDMPDWLATILKWMPMLPGPLGVLKIPVQFIMSQGAAAESRGPELAGAGFGDTNQMGAAIAAFDWKPAVDASQAALGDEIARRIANPDPNQPSLLETAMQTPGFSTLTPDQLTFIENHRQSLIAQMGRVATADEMQKMTDWMRSLPTEQQDQFKQTILQAQANTEKQVMASAVALPRTTALALIQEWGKHKAEVAKAFQIEIPPPVIPTIITGMPDDTQRARLSAIPKSAGGTGPEKDQPLEKQTAVLDVEIDKANWDEIQTEIKDLGDKHVKIDVGAEWAGKNEWDDILKSLTKTVDLQANADPAIKEVDAIKEALAGVQNIVPSIDLNIDPATGKIQTLVQMLRSMDPNSITGASASGTASPGVQGAPTPALMGGEATVAAPGLPGTPSPRAGGYAPFALGGSPYGDAAKAIANAAKAAAALRKEIERIADAASQFASTLKDALKAQAKLGELTKTKAPTVSEGDRAAARAQLLKDEEDYAKLLKGHRTGGTDKNPIYTPATPAELAQARAQIQKDREAINDLGSGGKDTRTPGAMKKRYDLVARNSKDLMNKIGKLKKQGASDELLRDLLGLDPKTAAVLAGRILKGGRKGVKDASKKATAADRAAAEAAAVIADTLDAAAAEAKRTTVEKARDLSTTITEALKMGTGNIARSGQAGSDAYKDWGKNLLNSISDSDVTPKMKKKLSKIVEEVEPWIKLGAARLKNFEEALQFRDQALEANKKRMSWGDYFNVTDMKTQLDLLSSQMMRETANMNLLRQQGFDPEMLKQIAELPPDQQGALLEQLATASPEQQAALKAAFQNYLNVGGGAANQIAADLYAESAEAAASGFKQGIEDKKAEVEKILGDIAAGVAQQITDALKVAAPKDAKSRSTTGVKGSPVGASKSATLPDSFAVGPAVVPYVLPPVSAAAAAPADGRVMVTQHIQAPPDMDTYTLASQVGRRISWELGA